MIEQLAVKKFYSIIVSMGKMGKMCVLRLTADKVNGNLLVVVIILTPLIDKAIKIKRE